MARISEVKNFMDDGWVITIKGKPQKELNEITEFVNHLETKENTEKELEKIKKGYCPEVSKASRNVMEMPPIKPQGMLYVVKDESMLELARNVVNAVEYQVEIPTGLESLKFNRKEETRNRILELIDYLKTYADWRE